jgi:hypothetical protein
MPIVGAQLEPGDILFKHASAGVVSQAIRKGQGSHYDAFVKNTLRVGPMGRDLTTDISHVAMAAGRDDVLEFDEGGAGTLNIVFGTGYGFVRGPVSIASRRGNRYEVFACTNQALRDGAVDKATLIWDITHQGRTTGSYGLSKVLGSSLRGTRGESHTLEGFEAQLAKWLDAATATGLKKLFTKSSIKFFCSEFVAYCYLWSAAESKLGRILGAEYVTGVDKSRISPAEFYARMETFGQSYFRFKGTLYTGA